MRGRGVRGEGRTRSRLHWLALLVVLVAACTSSGAGDPARVVESYLTAKVAADETALRPLLCSAMEGDLSIEATSFAGLGGKLDGMKCTRQGDTDVVACEGKITVTYGTEDRNFPLTSYKVVQEDGQWKWCGEAGS